MTDLTFNEALTKAAQAQGKVIAAPGAAPDRGDPREMVTPWGEAVSFPRDVTGLGDGELAAWHAYLAEWHTYIATQASLFHGARKALERARNRQVARQRVAAIRDGHKGNDVKYLAEGHPDVLALDEQLEAAELADAALSDLPDGIRSMLGVMREEVRRRKGAAGPQYAGRDGRRG